VLFAALSMLLTLGLMGGLLAFTEGMDHRFAKRMVRRAAQGPMPMEVAEKVVEQECARLLEGRIER
jgi:hypothetical protein